MAASRCVNCTISPPLLLPANLAPKTAAAHNSDYLTAFVCPRYGKLAAHPTLARHPENPRECLSLAWFRNREEARLVIKT